MPRLIAIRRLVAPAALLPALLIATLFAKPARAGVCSVPGSHATIQEAVDDPSCTAIELAAQTYAESVLIQRALTLSGPVGGAATIEGLVRVDGPDAQVELERLQVRNGCAPDALAVANGAQVTATGLEAVRDAALPCPLPATIFADGFESGDTSAWSFAVP